MKTIIKIIATTGVSSTNCDTPGARDYDNISISFIGDDSRADEYADVTLVPNYSGRLDAWGDISNWASEGIVRHHRFFEAFSESFAKEFLAGVITACRTQEIVVLEPDVFSWGEDEGHMDARAVIRDNIDDAGTLARVGRLSHDRWAGMAAEEAELLKVPAPFRKAFINGYVSMATFCVADEMAGILRENPRPFVCN